MSLPAERFQLKGHDGARATGEKGRFDVLVLDDSTFDQARIKRACNETGLPVSTTLAGDIDQFQKALDAKTYDMVVIDYLLPRGDGLEAQRIVQSHPTNFAAAIVMISSDMRTDVAVSSLKSGSMDCLDKDALDADKLRELLISSARMLAEVTRHWMGELLAQQREQIAADVARVVRDEMEYGRFIDAVDKRILETLAARGLGQPTHADPAAMLDSDEPFRFR